MHSCQSSVGWSSFKTQHMPFGRFAIAGIERGTQYVVSVLIRNVDLIVQNSHLKDLIGASRMRSAFCESLSASRTQLASSRWCRAWPLAGSTSNLTSVRPQPLADSLKYMYIPLNTCICIQRAAVLIHGFQTMIRFGLRTSRNNRFAGFLARGFPDASSRVCPSPGL